MNFSVEIGHKPCCLLIQAKTKQPQKIRIRVSNAQKDNTYYTDRYRTITGIGKFYVRLPQSPKIAKVVIYNEAQGNKKDDNSFELIRFNGNPFKLLPLKNKLSAFDFRNRDVMDFVNFAQRFSENAGVLSEGIYFSDFSKYRIDYMPVITKNGRVMKTPARISANNGVIDASSKIFRKYTVPARMAILLHEFSHIYVNDNPYNESEADVNALLIYLGMGYPRIEAERVFLKLFYNSATDQNMKRYNILSNMIRNFQKIPMQFVGYYYPGEA